MNTQKSSSKDLLEIYFDGACPVCSREMRYLRKRDKNNLISFIDVSAENFDPAAYNRTRDDFMKQIHARLPDGKIITGMEVFRQAYNRVGYGWLLFPTKLPLIKQIADFAYAVFARNRMKISKFLSRCGVDSCSI
jgi:predicted DCC family thiol-disulfide oxidoreductase YuxK